jgi:hypothetical protein
MGGKKKGKIKKKNKLSEYEHGVSDKSLEDERFIAATNRPQFKKSGRKDKGGGDLIVGFDDDQKIEIDERFASVLTDPRFRVDGDGKIDKYGREKKKNKSQAEAELSTFYKIKKDNEQHADEEKSSSSSDGDSEANSKQPSLSETDDEDESKSDQDKEKDSESLRNEEALDDPESRIAYLTALSRGEISVSSSDEDSSSSEDDDDSSVGSSDSDSSGEDSMYGKAGVLDPSTRAAEEEATEITFDPSPYLAVCNLDWKNIRAVDIMAVLSSFSPLGSVKSVTIYPSDFGLEQLKKEQLMGPQGIWKKIDRNNNNHKHTSLDNDVDIVDIGENSSSDDESNHKSDDEDESSASDNSISEENILESFDNFPSESAASQDGDTDFDPEKLRAYEASKLKYYFAVVEFANAEAADAAYKEVDGMEIGHSSSSFDLRSIPPSALNDVVKDREAHDKNTAIPSNYTPPDFVVSALQQSSVKCTWDEGDSERQRLLTQYGMGNETWTAMTEGDDLKAYLASDVSSDESDNDSDDSSTKKEKKGSAMRKLLGLESDDDGVNDKDVDELHNYDSDGTEESEPAEIEESEKQATFFPGKSDLEKKIRLKLDAKKLDDSDPKELTPWEKYQLKRKEKRKERRKEAKNKKNAYKYADDHHSDENSGSFSDKENDEDDFLIEDEIGSKKNDKVRGTANKGTGKQSKKPSSKEELSLLLSGQDEEEEIKDYDMRGILRIEKNKEKKLKGSRKRKEAKLAQNVSGTDFEINTKDGRFAALLDGDDDRFGIDRTDPNYKETKGMQQLLSEQSRRRRDKKRRKTTQTTDDFIVGDSSKNMLSSNDGALALSSLVKSLKSKVKK